MKGRTSVEGRKSTAKIGILIGFLLVVLVSISGLWLVENYLVQPSQAGFRTYSFQDNTLLISDDDILSYNWTSQEMAITSQASQRLTQMGDLYSWTGFVVKIDGEEVYRGVFRKYTMSAIPAPPSITILFPSVILPSETENYGAIRMFFPSFQPPSDQPLNNAKILQYFERTNKLVY